MARPVKTANSPDYRAKICEVAEALFAERGFDGTPIREIAEQTGATKALIYHYYQSKEALYLSLLEKDVSGVVTKLETIAASDGDPEEVFAFTFAAERGHTETVRILLDRGAKVNAKTSSGKQTALMKAAENGHTRIVKMLLDKGADPKVVDRYGYTAITFAPRISTRALFGCSKKPEI